MSSGGFNLKASIGIKAGHHQRKFRQISSLNANLFSNLLLRNFVFRRQYDEQLYLASCPKNVQQGCRDKEHENKVVFSSTGQISDVQPCAQEKHERLKLTESNNKPIAFEKNKN